MSLRCLGNCQLHKNPSLFFEGHCTRTFHLLLYLFTFTLGYYLYLGVHPMPLPFFIRTNKILMRLNVFFFIFYLFIYLFIFEGFRPQSVLTVFLFSMKHSYLTPDSKVLVNGKKNYKINPDERATAGDSLRVRRKLILN